MSCNLDSKWLLKRCPVITRSVSMTQLVRIHASSRRIYRVFCISAAGASCWDKIKYGWILRVTAEPKGYQRKQSQWMVRMCSADILSRTSVFIRVSLVESFTKDLLLSSFSLPMSPFLCYNVCLEGKGSREEMNWFENRSPHLGRFSSIRRLISFSSNRSLPVFIPRLITPKIHSFWLTLRIRLSLCK